jgi:hypothetical protein
VGDVAARALRALELAAAATSSLGNQPLLQRVIGFAEAAAHFGLEPPELRRFALSQ